jgi:hypothetical protein
MPNEGNFTAYVCVKAVYVGLNGSKLSRKLNIGMKALFDGSTVKFLDSGGGMAPNQSWGYNAEFFYPQFQLAIDNGFFVEDTNYKYELEVSKNSVITGKRLKRLNFTGTGVFTSLDPNDNEIVNISIPGGGGGGGSGDQIVSPSGYFNCTIDVLVGDLVYIDGPDSVEVSDRTIINTTPCVGIVIDKPAATSATVLFSGRCDIFAGLSPGSQYYLGPFGALASSPPIENGEVFQKIGVAVNTTTLWVIIDPPIITESV